MKCTSCGLPLSPARTITNCPRCGTPIADKKSSSSPAQQPSLQTVPYPPDRMPWKAAVPQPQLPEVVRSPMSHPGEEWSGSDPFHPADAHVYSPITFPPASPAAPAYMPQTDLGPNPQPQRGFAAELSQLGNEASPLPLRGQASSNTYRSWPGDVQGEGNDGSQAQQPREAEMLRFAQDDRLYASAQHQPWQGKDAKADQSAFGGIGTIHRPLRRGKNNIGFIVAGLCVITGGLILVFVYFMAIGLPGNSTTTGTTKTNTASSSSPTSASTPVSSPTANPFPGQKYIDHPQMASGIDPTSHQATQSTTTFKTNSLMYIFFQLHPAGQNGAVCLQWYANNKLFFSFQLPVNPSQHATYSYTSYGGTGSGYVEIYWASTVKCSDKILAQHVNFTVTS